MKLGMNLIFAGALGMASCSTNSESETAIDDASGVYVREYAIEISNLESGKKIGMRHIRDSIFIEFADKGYKVSNRKWRMNDYDQEGWVSMAHADNRPMPTFFASYDEKTNILMPRGTTASGSIFLDQENGKLYKGESMKNGYRKIDSKPLQN